MAAPYQIQGLFHPNYLELHRQAQFLLGQPHAITFKGGAGEGQRNPCKPCQVLTLDNGDTYPWSDEPLDVARIRALWDGSWEEKAPRLAVTGTTAMCLLMLGRATSQSDAQDMAEAMWLRRHA